MYDVVLRRLGATARSGWLGAPVVMAFGAVVLVLSAGLPGAVESAAGSVGGGAPAAGALELRTVQQVTPRLSELTVFSPALGRETSLRVLTPEGFDPATDRLPVLYLLHGGFGEFRDWSSAGNAEGLTAGLDLIVVMPDGGQGGWYDDWDASTTQGAQRWETYQVEELVPFVQDRYGSRTDRSGTAVVGLSMGGFGALHHAARHPDTYGFAAAFSGAVDNLHPGIASVIDISPLIMGGQPGDIWGRAGTNETRWRAENPVDLAANLATVAVQLRTGNGQPGGVHGGAFDIQEEGVSQATATLHARLDELGIDHLYDDYGPGAHTWPYWRDALAATLPAVVAATATPVADPTTVDHLAFEPAFSVWGHDVALARTNLESTVLSVHPDGFGIRGSGSGTVTTPDRYRPGTRVRATAVVAGTGSGPTSPSIDLVVGADGRVVVPVDLGPANELDEHEAGPDRRVVALDVALAVLPDQPAPSVPPTSSSTPAPAAPGTPGGAVPATPAAAIAGRPDYTG